MIGYLITLYYLLLLVVLQVVKEAEMINKTCRGKQTRNGICTSEGDVKVLCHLYAMYVCYVGIYSALLMTA
jgi:hypothetical protein